MTKEAETMMKKTASLLLSLFAFALFAADSAQEIVRLPAPDKEGGMPLMKALTERRTERAYVAEPLSLQTVGDMLYATGGMNRPGKLVIPTARNLQDLVLYCIDSNGVWRYLPAEHALQKIASGDFRETALVQRKLGANASILIVFASDSKKFPDEEMARKYSGIHVGEAVQNLYLYCASNDLATVVCGMWDRELLKSVPLPDGESIILIQAVGVPEDKAKK